MTDRGCDNCDDQFGCSSDGLNWLCDHCMAQKEEREEEE